MKIKYNQLNAVKDNLNKEIINVSKNTELIVSLVKEIPNNWKGNSGEKYYSSILDCINNFDELNTNLSSSVNYLDGVINEYKSKEFSIIKFFGKK